MRFPWFLLVLAAVAGPTSARAATAPHPTASHHPIAPPPDSAGRRAAVDRVFSEAVAAERRGDVRSAIGAYRAVIKADSGYAEANYRLGTLYAALDHFREAALAYRLELRFHPGHPLATRELGLTLARMGQGPQAVATLEPLSRAQPTDDQTWQALGFAYSVAGRAADAEAALRRAIEYPPDRASEHRDLGVILAASGRTADARSEYRAAIAIDDQDPGAWANLGNLEARAGNWKDALAAYRASEARDSTFAIALQGQVLALDAIGDKRAAAATARRWLRLRPDDHRARLEAVNRYEDLGDGAGALALAQEGVALNPNSGDAHVLLARAWHRRGRPRDQARELRAATRLFKDPLGRGQALHELQLATAALPESLRAVVHADSLEEAARLGAGAAGAR